MQVWFLISQNASPLLFRVRPVQHLVEGRMIHAGPDFLRLEIYSAGVRRLKISYIDESSPWGDDCLMMTFLIVRNSNWVLYVPSVAWLSPLNRFGWSGRASGSFSRKFSKYLSS